MERTAAQFGLEFLGAAVLIQADREGGDKGLPVSLAGPESKLGKAFYDVAKKVVAAEKIAAQVGVCWRSAIHTGRLMWGLNLSDGNWPGGENGGCGAGYGAAESELFQLPLLRATLRMASRWVRGRSRGCSLERLAG